jgi:hypothetical protein
MWFMPLSPVPADPGPDEDLAWLDRDPEREDWLDRARARDEPPGEEEYEDYIPLTVEELEEIREAAADELLAVKAATTGRRGPGMALDVLPGCPQLAVAADVAGRTASRGCRRPS